jgi:two-component system, NtrC family, response regulator AtoC
MSQASIHVLIVEDDESASELIAMFLQARGHRVEQVSSGPAALARLALAPTPDVVVIDVMMPEMGGLEVLRRYREADGVAPVVMISAVDEPQTVVQAMRHGATDFVTKPINQEELLETLERVVELRPLRASTSTSVIATPGAGRRHLGTSAAMRRVEALCDRVADADVPILITGESGVGKDVVARELHARSPRRDKVFVKINCAALPENLLESELFGYERGAFTGAQRAKPGQFELADGGTLFLDEIGEMPAPLQAKLLQALQDGEFYRVGGQKKVRVDVRVIVATNLNLELAIRDGRFREDLYYRLNVVQMRIPPLRERREDIPTLLAHFVERYGRRYGRTAADVPPEVVRRFLEYDWPGNVRELENLVRRLMVLRDPSYVYAEMRPDRIGTAPPPMAPPPPPRDPSPTGPLAIGAAGVVPIDGVAVPTPLAMVAGGGMAGVPTGIALPGTAGAAAAMVGAPGGAGPGMMGTAGMAATMAAGNLPPNGLPGVGAGAGAGMGMGGMGPGPGAGNGNGNGSGAGAPAVQPAGLPAGAVPGGGVPGVGAAGYPGADPRGYVPGALDPYAAGPMGPPLQPLDPASARNVVGFPADPPRVVRGGSYPFGGYASHAAARPLGEVVAEEFSNAGEDGRVDLKALGRKAAEIAEREAIVAMLARTGGSKREAADRLGISYKAILYKIREFGIAKPRVARKPTAPPVEAAILDEADAAISFDGLEESEAE